MLATLKHEPETQVIVNENFKRIRYGIPYVSVRFVNPTEGRFGPIWIPADQICKSEAS